MNAASDTLRGKTVLVTGGTGGIGKATALGLAQQGATVIITGRDGARADASVAEIAALSGNAAVSALLADLSSQADTRRLAEAFLSQHRQLHVLVNNVGGLYEKRWETADGIEATFAMNVVGPFLLTNLLLPALKAAAPARVVNVNSSMHSLASMNFDDLEARRWYRGLDIYARAKLANVLWSYELARQLKGKGVTVNVADPGGAATEMTAGMTPAMVPWFMRAAWPLFRVFQRGQTTAKAAVSSVYLASSPGAEGQTGGYYSASGKRARSSRASYSDADAHRLWESCARLAAPGAPAPATAAAASAAI